MSLGMVLIQVSAQSPDYPEITAENADQILAIRQLGYGTIVDIAFSPDGQSLAVGTYRGVALYDVDNFSEEPRFFEGGGKRIAFSPDNSVLASENHLWDVATGHLLYEFDGYSPVFTADGSRIIVVSGQAIVGLDRETGAEVLRQAVGQNIQQIRLSADDLTLALDAYGIVLWSLETGAQTVELSAVQYPTIFSGETVFSPDGRMLLHAGFDGYALWDVETGEVIRFQDTWFNPGLESADFSPDGTQIAIGDANAGISIYDTATGELESSFRHEDEVQSVTFSPAGRLLAAAGANGIVHIWNTGTGEEYARLTGYNGAATVLGFNDTDAILSAVSIDGAASQWDVNTGELIGTAQGYRFEVSHGTVPYPNAIELNENGNLLATGSVIDGRVHLWSPDGQSLGNFETREGQDVIDVAFTPDSNIIAALSYRNVYIWELETGARITGLRVGDRFATDIAFSPNGSILAIGDRLGLTTLQDRRTASVVAEFQGTEGDVTNLTFSPDGTIIAFTSFCWSCSPGEYDYDIQIGDTNTGETLHHLEGHTDFVEALGFSPDGSVLASGARDGTLRFWNPVTGETLAVIETWALTLSFSHDGSMLATTSATGSIQLWEIATES